MTEHAIQICATPLEPEARCRRLDDLPPVLRATDLLQILPAGRKQIYAGLASGAIPSVRLGRVYLVSKEALLSWLNASAGAR
jgi:excisionase family DNA binding protein